MPRAARIVRMVFFAVEKSVAKTGLIPGTVCEIFYFNSNERDEAVFGVVGG